jgi:hypothetical protein
MPSEPLPPTLFEIARRASEVADPTGEDADVGMFESFFQDDEEPVTAEADLSDRIEEARRAVDPEYDLPHVTMAAAVATYLAYRRDEIGLPRHDLLRLAARAEFDGHPPAEVADWLKREKVRP